MEQVPYWWPINIRRHRSKFPRSLCTPEIGETAQTHESHHGTFRSQYNRRISSRHDGLFLNSKYLHNITCSQTTLRTTRVDSDQNNCVVTGSTTLFPNWATHMFWPLFQLNGTRSIMLLIISIQPDVIWLIANPRTQCVPDRHESVRDTSLPKVHNQPLLKQGT
jgi:hypothetical protein